MSQRVLPPWAPIFRRYSSSTSAISCPVCSDAMAASSDASQRLDASRNSPTSCADLTIRTSLKMSEASTPFMPGSPMSFIQGITRASSKPMRPCATPAASIARLSACRTDAAGRSANSAARAN